MSSYQYRHQQKKENEEKVSTLIHQQKEEERKMILTIQLILFHSVPVLFLEVDIKNFYNESYEDESSDEEEVCDSLPHSNWIIDIDLLLSCLQRSCVCRFCHNKVDMVEIKSYRAGLGTKFSFKCSNIDCELNDGFLSTRKSGRIYDVNRKSALAGRIAGKSRRGILKICSILGLSTPVTRPQFIEHVKFWEMKAIDLHYKVRND